jgi:hypothetical protein
MSRHTGSKRDRSPPLRLEPLEDRLLLAAGSTALMLGSPPSSVSSTPSNHQPTANPGQLGTSSSAASHNMAASDPAPDDSSEYDTSTTAPAATSGSSSANGSRTSATQPAYDPKEAAALAIIYPPKEAPAAVQAAQAALGIAIQSQLKPASDSHSVLVSAAALPTPADVEALAVAIANAARSAPTATALPGGASPQPADPVDGGAFQSWAGVEELTAPTSVPLQTQAARSSTALALELPAQTPGEWTRSACGLLATLEALDSQIFDRESLWIRLGFWGLSATTVIALCELGRQQLRKRQEDELDLAVVAYPDRAAVAPN